MRFYTKISLLLLLIIPVFGFSQFRKYSNEFLNIGAGARGLAMGGAQVASAKDATAGYWNPAGLTGIKEYPNVGIMHAEYFGGIAKYDYLSAAMPIQDNKRALGFSLQATGKMDGFTATPSKSTHADASKKVKQKS